MRAYSKVGLYDVAPAPPLSDKYTRSWEIALLLDTVGASAAPPLEDDAPAPVSFLALPNKPGVLALLVAVDDEGPKFMVLRARRCVVTIRRSRMLDTNGRSADCVKKAFEQYCSTSGYIVSYKSVDSHFCKYSLGSTSGSDGKVLVQSLSQTNFFNKAGKGRKISACFNTLFPSLESSRSASFSSKGAGVFSPKTLRMDLAWMNKEKRKR